jgi:hypothetical protein
MSNSNLTKAQKTERSEALARLHGWLKPGNTVHTIVRHVSRSGMSRDISIVLMTPEGPIHPNHAVARALGMRLVTVGGHDAIRVGGCGMDMGFAIVYELSRALWPDGFGCIGEKCRSNDHSNGDRNRVPNEDRSGACEDCRSGDFQHTDKGAAAHQTHWHRDGGYALRQEWL